MSVFRSTALQVSLTHPHHRILTTLEHNGGTLVPNDGSEAQAETKHES